MSRFEFFRKLARDENLSHREKVGFLDIHRKESEHRIFPDIQKKLNLKSGGGGNILDIGCGCSKPVLDLIAFAKQNRFSLYLVDSQEMLDLLPNEDCIIKINAEFPKHPLSELWAKMDYVLAYSVIQCLDISYLDFIDSAVELLASGGRLLIGDIPNIEKKKRFLESEEGMRLHQEWSGGMPPSKISQKEIQEGINDEKILELLRRYRASGYEAYLLEQMDGMPLNQTREDLLIVRRS